MRLLWSDLERRAIGCVLLDRMRHMAPSPGDLAALAVELAEMARESIGHVLDGSPRHGTRAELELELERVAVVAREASKDTTTVRQGELGVRGAAS